jgi:SAM-dependent methyltransferase
VNGLDVDDVFRIFGFMGSMRPGLLVDVFLQYVLHRTATRKNKELKQRLNRQGSSTAPQEMNIKRMVNKIDRLKKKKTHRGQWTEYVRHNTYSEETELEKVSYMESFLKEYSPGTVLDLGCNTGRYSLLASEYGAKVVAADADHDCVDILYQHAEKVRASIIPLQIDLANPSPALGFCHKERKSFMERINADAVFALALVHHLLITSRIPLLAIRDFFYDLTNSYLVVEFVGRDDEMFQQLLALREDIYADINRESFVSIFKQKFELMHEYQISNSQRSLFTFKKK